MTTAVSPPATGKRSALYGHARNAGGTLILLALCVGCSLGPDYVRPALDLPAAADNATLHTAPFTDTQWWHLFADPTLDRLEREAIQHNLDLRYAMARIEEARALARIARADRLPWLGIGAAAARGRSTAEAAIPGKSRTGDSFQALGLCSFEVDLWGRYRRLDEAARAELLATTAARDTVRLALTAEVARLYFQLRTLQAQTRIARTQLTSYDKTCALYRKRWERGYTQELDVRRIEADRLATEALVYRRENELSQTQTALSLLLGRSPQRIVQGRAPDGKALENLQAPPPVPGHIPSDLLTRRPDVRQAEGRLMAASARIGAARAALFPAISLTGRYGFVSSELQELFTDRANLWSAAGALTQPVFEGGRLRAGVQAARARHEQMLSRYGQTVRTAFRETRDALVAGTKTAQALTAAHARARAMRRSLELSRTQHAHGHISVIDVLDIERHSLQAELDLAAARRDRLESVVALCQALGGGWHEQTGFAPLSEKPVRTDTEKGNIDAR